MKVKLINIAVIALGLLAFNACGGWWEKSTARSSTLPPAAPLPSDEEATKISLRFLEARIKRDPEDFISHNQLAGYYLRFLRETGDARYLDLASRAARASLEVLPPEMNAEGLYMLTQVEYASHDFAGARDHAKLLTRLEPRKSYPYLLLGDALIELGEYEKAASAYHRIEQVGWDTETRLARLALLRGQTDIAVRHFSNAIADALEEVPPPRETIAWCRWQLGETAFSIGDYQSAERHYRDALVTFPGYYRALASLGRALAARGDLSGAIEQYERVVHILPDPSLVAALGDLYKLAGRDKEAAAQYSLVEQIAGLNTLNGALYNRQLALFYADHDMKAEEAYAIAKKEYGVRRDIYGADALAWAALKAGKLIEAQAAIKEALRLGTKDARLLYHAGMIARAAGDNRTANDYLSRALKLNPQFDPLQAVVAKKTLEQS